jgi:hypothetical protein
MPYKDPERKRQWERDHREQRNARRIGSRQSSTPKVALDVSALRTRRMLAPDPSSDQSPKSTWKTILG